MADYTLGYEPVDTELVTVTQAAHGFTMPGRGFIPVYKNAGVWESARANNADTLHQGFIVTIIDANTFVMQFGGTLVQSAHGLTDDYYYLSSAAAGAVTATEPSGAGTYSAPVASVIDSSHVHLRTNRPVGGALAVTENSGIATLLSANTSVTVTHGLSSTPLPQNIKISFYQDHANTTVIYFDNITATTFDIIGDINPGTNISVSWEAKT